jgi:IS5 family transposase
MVGRYAHAHQFKRARRALKFPRTRLGRLIRDIRRKIEGNDALETRFAAPLDLGLRGMFQDQRKRGRKGHAPHAPDVECIGKGKARAPYEFGSKVSVATPVTQPKGGQFVLHAQALHEVKRIHVDKGYRGHTYPNTFRGWISGQVRNVTATIRREMKRRAAVEPVIGHLNAEHRMDRNHLKGHDGDRANPILAAAGHNFRLLIRWLAAPLRVLFQTLFTTSHPA